MTSTHDRISTALSGRYRIERELGRGGMAVVYFARDQQHDRPVAIKVLRADLASGSAADRFLREIRIAARLQHPLIVGLIDSGVTADEVARPFYVMPFVDGPSLRDHLAGAGPLPPDEAIRLTREIGDALAFAHRSGVVHRDVQPENVLVGQGHAMVTDFGIAHAVRAAGDGTFDGLTQAGVTLGTPAYMSPEQAVGEASIDARSDQYSLACVLFEMLTGRPPFTAPTAAALIAQHVVKPAPSVTTLRVDVPTAMASAIDRALAKNASDRHDSIESFLVALTAPSAGVPAPDRSIAVLPFANLSAEADNEYFSDGLTDEVLSHLAELRHLRVVSRTSSMRYKRSTLALRSIASELGVRYLVEGSVRRAGPSLRVTSQLVDSVTDAPVWTRTFGGTVDDVFAVQEQIARDIATALDIRLSSREDGLLARRPLRDPEAFDMYLRARALLWRFAGFGEADALLEAAHVREGENATLLALRAYSRMTQVFFGFAGSNAGAMRADARRLADRVVALEPDLADGHFVRGFIAVERGDLPAACAALKRALARRPNHTEAQAWMANCLLQAGRLDASRVYTDAMRVADPLSSWGWALASFVDLFAGRFADAQAPMARGIELQPDGLFPRWQYGYARALHGDVDGAAATARILEAVNASSPYTVQALSLVDALRGDAGRARDRLSTVAGADLDGHTTFHLAEAHAMAGDLDGALQLLRRAIATGFYALDFIARHCPFLESLRREAGFEVVLAEAKRQSDAFRD